VIRAQRGDPAAFEELVSALEKPMFYYVRRLVRNEEDAWDILQEVWTKSFRNLGSLRETRRYRVWLYSIAHKITMSHQRSVYRSLDVFEDVPAPEFADESEARPNEEDAERVHFALDRIDAPFREVLTLRFLEDLSVEEISEVIGVPMGTVKSRLHYAKQALKKVLEREEKI
jgi:RNA polymerase sigma factor (sigma-70 family)